MVAKTIAPTGRSIAETLKETGEDCNLPEGYWVGRDDIKQELKEWQKQLQEKQEYTDDITTRKTS